MVMSVRMDRRKGVFSHTHSWTSCLSGSKALTEERETKKFGGADRQLCSRLLAVVTSLLGFTFSPSWRGGEGLEKKATTISIRQESFWP